MSTPRQRSSHGARSDGSAAATVGDALPAPLQDDATWAQVLGLLLVDLEASAHATGALLRQRRARSAADLLRLVLAFVLVASSFRLLAAWALLRSLGALSDVAVRRRLRHYEAWLELLLTASLARVPRGPVPGGQRLRLIDATTASRPGATGTEFRLHLAFDLAQWRIVAVELTDARGGETLTHHRVAAPDIVVADRGYAHRAGLGHALALVRQLPSFGPKKARGDLIGRWGA